MADNDKTGMLTMLRKPSAKYSLLSLLVVANLLAFAWLQGWLAPLAGDAGLLGAPPRAAP